MTPETVRELVAETSLPPGFTLDVHPQRQHRYRALWDIRVLRDGERVWGRAFYDVAAGIDAARREAWALSGVGA